MKKFFALLLAMTLCLTCSCALAAGLGGLGGGLAGLGGGLDGLGGSALPDPAAVLGAPGQLLQADYAFAADYLCDAYVYARPGSISSFIDDYTFECRNAGYTLAETSVEGQAAYRIQCDNAGYALLVPNFSGQMLLLVQKGMNFTMQKRINYATLTYNNRDYDLDLYFSSTFDISGGSRYWSLTYKGERAPFETFNIAVPMTVREGDELYADSKKNCPNFNITQDLSTTLLYGKDGFGDWIESGSDYARVNITRVEDTEDGVLVEGVLNASFRKKSIVIENMLFSGVIDD